MTWAFLAIPMALRTTAIGGGAEILPEVWRYARRAASRAPDDGDHQFNAAFFPVLAGRFDLSAHHLREARRIEEAGLGTVRWMGARAMLGVLRAQTNSDDAVELLDAGLSDLEGDTHVFAPVVSLAARIARAEVALRAGDLTDAQQRFAAVESTAEADVARPGMWHFYVRGALGVVKCAHLRDDSHTRDLALERARLRWADEGMRKIGTNSSVQTYSLFDWASCMATLGKHDEAAAFLAEACDHLWACLPQLHHDPAFDGMRDHPHLLEVVARCEKIILDNAEPEIP